MTTAKRFEVVLNEFDEVEYIMDKTMMEDRDFAEFIDFVEDVCKENEQLKQQLSDVRKENYGNLDGLNYYQEQNGHLSSKISDLECENEQLKQFKEYVFNKIDMHLRMLPTARDNEFNEYDGDPSLYTGAIYMLETLKKELKE